MKSRVLPGIVLCALLVASAGPIAYANLTGVYAGSTSVTEYRKYGWPKACVHYKKGIMPGAEWDLHSVAGGKIFLNAVVFCAIELAVVGLWYLWRRSRMKASEVAAT